MNIIELIEKIKNSKDCTVFKSCGFPSIGKSARLPNDLKQFYEKCGGMSLFPNKRFGFKIVNPQEFIVANPVIVGDICEYDISSNWYIICSYKESNYITIDLQKDRLGRCYDSFWDRHGVVGECAIIAESFTELISNLFNSRGETIYWLDADFQCKGDAYDEI